MVFATFFRFGKSWCECVENVTWKIMSSRPVTFCLSYVDCACGLFLRILQPFMVTLAISLISLIVYIYFSNILPLTGVPLFSLRGILQSLYGIYLLFSILFNYLTTMFSDPGGTEGLVDMLDDLESGTLLESRATQRHCEKCKRPKPDRAHHCSTCRRCILKMDHHCPWVGNCVGERNYRHFILFLFFLLSGCCFVMAVTIPTLQRLYLKTYFGDLKSLDEVPFFSRYLGFLTAHVNVKHYSGASFAVMLCTSVSCALAIMGGFHMYLVLTNQTTIEMQKMKNGRVEIGADGRPTEPGSYSRGMKLNFQELFDVVDRKFWWIVWLRPEFPKPLPPHRRAQPGCIERCLCWLRCCKAREEPKHK
eukprot:2924_1